MKTQYTSLLLSFSLLTAINLFAFSSGSDESDGALLLDDPGNTIVFDPFALGLDTDGDGIFHFTTITVTANTTVRLSAREIDRPIFWLATGDVDLSGILDLNGETGQNGTGVLNNGEVQVAIGGAGGYHGGVGQVYYDESSFATDGGGPGAGVVRDGDSGTGGVNTYMNKFGVPLVGGSGGGGGASNSQYAEGNPATGGGGGAGGGCILIASDTFISIPSSGAIHASGGGGGLGVGKGGGGGSGGMIRIVAPTLNFKGSLNAGGGTGGYAGWPYLAGQGGQSGIIRIETTNRTLGGACSPPATYGALFATFLPDRTAYPWPSLAITEVGGIAISDPQSSFEIPDALINTTEAVTVVAQSTGIPVGTEITLFIFPENGDQQTLTGTLTGSIGSGTASFSVIFPTGHSRGYATAVWGESVSH